MILVDTNVIMYAAGAEHAFKDPAVSFLERAVAGEIVAMIDAETLREILHRYRSIGRWEDGKRVYDLARKVLPLTIPVDEEIVDRARELMDQYPRLIARDAVHAAVVLTRKLDGIATFDRDFDGIRGVKRIEPKTKAPRKARG
ncbi:MAG: type II toxin-antitoxin system VapC family toxin [Thermoanaerobaculia bacterium]|nr:type II toxin-antitoxin system VapC family toxin [Thermoanaerobaculia bacterium]